MKSTASTNAEMLKQTASIILHPSSGYGDVKRAIDELYQLFTNVGAYTIDTTEPNNKRGTDLQSGLAVSIATAAKCLFDIARTRVYAAGLLKAIKTLQQSGGEKPLQVLYAGCGPYALQALLVAPFVENVEFTLLDVHKECLQSATKLIEALGLQSHFPSIMEADATQYKWKNKRPLNVVIAECMQRGLQNETQVSIAANLAAQLVDTGIMIPQCISVEAMLVHYSKRHSVKMGVAHFTTDELYYSIGKVVTLNKESALNAAANIHHPFAPVSLPLPVELLTDAYQLELHTTINVFDEWILDESESSLTLPLKLADAPSLLGKEKIHFIYKNGNKPGIEWSAV